MEVPSQIPVLIRTNEIVFNYTETKYLRQLHHFTPVLLHWLAKLNDTQTIPEDLKDKTEEIWKFRKLINAYIGILVQCSDKDELPSSVLGLSHSIGQIKDILQNGAQLNSKPLTYWISLVQKNLQELCLSDATPKPPEMLHAHLEELMQIIVDLTKQRTLPVEEFHNLRKRIRSFLNQYSIILDEDLTFVCGDITEPEIKQLKSFQKKLKKICNEMGQIHDQILQEIFKMLGEHTDFNFEEVYASKKVTLESDMFDLILKIFSQGEFISDNN